MSALYFSVVPSPIGNLTIVADTEAVQVVTFREIANEGAENNITRVAAKELAAYFEGKLRIFTFPIIQKGTAFQKEVWERLLVLPFGTTTTYAKFSAHHPLAIRAIAAANGKNNIAIAVPCHRVIGTGGKLVGYAGGLWRKQWLLEHEQRIAGTGQATIQF